MKPILPMLLLLLQTGFALAGDGEQAEPEIAYYALEPAVITNVQGKYRYVKAEVQLMTERPDKLTDIEANAPALRHALLMLLTDQDGEVLRTPSGKEALRKQALEAVRKTLKELTGKKLVEELYFTAFFVQ